MTCQLSLNNGVATGGRQSSPVRLFCVKQTASEKACVCQNDQRVMLQCKHIKGSMALMSYVSHPEENSEEAEDAIKFRVCNFSLLLLACTNDCCRYVITHIRRTCDSYPCTMRAACHSCEVNDNQHAIMMHMPASRLCPYQSGKLSVGDAM